MFAFKYDNFSIIANNQALVDFSSVLENCKNTNVIHINRAIHINKFKTCNNFLALHSWQKSKFIGYDCNKSRSNLFDGIFFILKPGQTTQDRPYEDFQKYIDEFPHKNKTIIHIGASVSKNLLRGGQPSAGFNVAYYLHDLYKNAQINLIGFSGHHKLPNGKMALDGHPVSKEQLWYKSQSKIALYLNNPPCSELFDYPCAMCNAQNFNDSKSMCTISQSPIGQYKMKKWSKIEDDKYSWLYKNNYPIGQPMRVVKKFNLDKNLSCIDLGCGRASLSTHFTNYTGVDVSEYIIEFNKLNRSGKYIHASLDDLSPIDDFYDVAICSDVMEHLPPDQIKNVLKSISSLSVKDFYFVISTRKSFILDKEKKNLHLSVFSASVWRNMFLEFFKITNEDISPTQYTLKCQTK